MRTENDDYDIFGATDIFGAILFLDKLNSNLVHFDFYLQAVATGLVAVGFGESIAKLFGTEDMKIVKLVAAATLLVLTG